MSNRKIISMIVGVMSLALSMIASGQAMYIAPDGKVGVGTDEPLYLMDVIGSHNGSAEENEIALYVTNESAVEKARFMLGLHNNGPTKFQIKNTAVADADWVFTVGSFPSFRISRVGTPVVEFQVMPTGDAIVAGVLIENSDVNDKQEIEPVDGDNILQKLKALEISEWSYKDAPGVRHVGPMAQDFYTAYGLGNTKKGITSLDTSGIALAAIKALIEENATQSEYIEKLEMRVNMMERQQAETQAIMVKVLENQQAERVLTSTVMN